MKKSLCMVFCLACLVGFFLPVYAQSGFCHGSREQKYVALTFDDGPHPRYTEKILSVLEKYNVKATFFMIGTNVALYPEMAKAVCSAGHEIGCHTYSHPHMKQISAAQLTEEVEKCEALFASLGIPRPKLFRPPEGFRSEAQVRLLEEKGYRIVIWSLDPKDWQGTPSAQMVTSAITQVKGGDILLFHDYISGQNNTIAAIEQLIPRLLESGYQFVTISEMMRAEGSQSVEACSFSACSFK